MGISKFKQIGVWDKFPQALKDKARAAKGSWAGLKITQKDLDSIPDDAWEKTAVVLGVKWRYATATRGMLPCNASLAGAAPLNNCKRLLASSSLLNLKGPVENSSFSRAVRSADGSMARLIFVVVATKQGS